MRRDARGRKANRPRRQSLALRARRASYSSKLIPSGRPRAKELQALRDQVAELKRQQGPRTLTDEQQQAMVAILKEAPGKIVIPCGSAEGDEYARYFLDTFRDAGWDADIRLQLLSAALHDVSVHALPGNESAALVMRALGAAKVEGVSREEVDEATVETEGPLQLAVGPRSNSINPNPARRLSADRTHELERVLAPFDGK